MGEVKNNDKKVLCNQPRLIRPLTPKCVHRHSDQPDGTKTNTHAHRGTHRYTNRYTHRYTHIPSHRPHHTLNATPSTVSAALSSCLLLTRTEASVCVCVPYHPIYSGRQSTRTGITAVRPVGTVLQLFCGVLSVVVLRWWLLHFFSELKSFPSPASIRSSPRHLCITRNSCCVPWTT